jgi:hypothetical protein
MRGIYPFVEVFFFFWNVYILVSFFGMFLVLPFFFCVALYLRAYGGWMRNVCTYIMGLFSLLPIDVSHLDHAENMSHKHCDHNLSLGLVHEAVLAHSES